MLKEAHDKYGIKVVLNAFYRTDYYYGDDEFTLAEMTDAYKSEWEANSDWLKIGLHAKQEFPDYPHVNIDYADMKKMYVRFKNEVIRFAGVKTLSTAFNPHWSPVSKEGLKAMVKKEFTPCRLLFHFMVYERMVLPEIFFSTHSRE